MQMNFGISLLSYLQQIGSLLGMLLYLAVFEEILIVLQFLIGDISKKF